MIGRMEGMTGESIPSTRCPTSRLRKRPLTLIETTLASSRACLLAARERPTTTPPAGPYRDGGKV